MSPVVPPWSPYMDQLEVIPVILIFRPVLAYRGAIEDPAEVIHLTHLLAGQNIDEVFRFRVFGLPAVYTRYKSFAGRSTSSMMP